MTTEQTFQAILTLAIKQAGSAAAFDFGLSRGSVGYSLANAYYRLAKVRLGVPEDESPLDHGYSQADVSAEEARIRAEIAPLLAARTEQAKTRTYTGWSRASRGPIRYAN